MNNKFQIIELEDPCKSIKEFFNLQSFESDIITWCSENINFSDEISAQRDRLDFSQYPYQIEPLKACADLNSRKIVTVVFPEQCGKTAIFINALLYRMVFDPGQAMICYPSDGLATETNQTKISPLMRHIPQLATELEKPRSYRADRYALSNNIVYFQGSGSKIVSKSCHLVIGDEIDQWDVSQPNNVQELLKRTRSYDSSLAILVCTPTFENGRIWQSFLEGSQGYYWLRCQKCGKLSMRSCDTRNLQFESSFNEGLRTYVVKPGSCRLVCPDCGFQHTEDLKHDMICQGEYIHKIPELIATHPSFQCGVLASQLKSLEWEYVANQQLAAGKSSDINTQQSFDNSIRGLPWKQRKVSKDEIAKLKETHHCDFVLKKEDVEMIMVTADTMDEYIRYVVCAWDINDNMHILEIGECDAFDYSSDKRAALNEVRRHENKEDVVTLGDILKRQYLELPVQFALIDCGGHRQPEVQQFCKEYGIAFMQKGTSMVAKLWYRSENVPKMFMTNAKQFQAMMLYQLYSQKDKEQNFLYLADNIADEYLEEIKDLKPDDGVKWGSEFQNWKPKSGKDHAADCLRYLYCAREICKTLLHKNKFLQCKSPMLLKRFGVQIATNVHEQQNTEQKSSFFDL